MAEGGFSLQNQLKFNLGVPLSAANIAVRYHKPNPIVIERAGGVVDGSHRLPQGPVSRSPGQSSLNLSIISEDRLALAVQLAKRDIKKRKEQDGGHSRTPSPKSSNKPRRPLVSKGGTKMVHTKECKDRMHRLQEKRGRDPLKVREQGWNSGTSVARTQTPPRDKRQNLPVTTNSPPTRDTDNYPVKRFAPLDSPVEEIGRLQKEIEGYLQQIQVIEQRAMRDQSADIIQPSKTRRKDGYLSDEEDPTRRALRQEEQATRAARQIYFLRQQVRSLQEVVTRKGPGSVKHTKKSQTMLRLAAAHRGAVRAIQSFVNQQLPQQDLRRGLPTGYHELALLIRQLALVSTQIKRDKDSSAVDDDLIKMLDRVDDLNKAWCLEIEAKAETAQGYSKGERRRKSPTGRQPEGEPQRGRSLQPKRAGKENRPKGLLKKQYNKQTKPRKQESRKLTPERQNILRTGLESLVREDPSLRQQPSGMTWNIPMDTSIVSEPANTSLILPKPLQHKRERAQKSLPLDVPETHFSDPTVSFNLKTVQPDDYHSEPSKEPWKPSGSVGASPSRQPRSKSAERSRSFSKSRSQERSRSKSPRSARHVIINDVDEELISELFPQGQHKQRSRPRSASPGSPRHHQRARSPPRSGPHFAHSARGRIEHLQRGARDAAMARGLHRETAEISLRQMLADRVIEKAGINGELLSEMILQDLLVDEAEEMESLEEEVTAGRHAAAIHHNPTLENMFQRLEQMELEQNDIRRRWGTLQFEEESSRRTTNLPERPSAPVAMEITRERPTQSHRVQSSRAFSKATDEPIIFTKSAPVPKFQEKTVPLGSDEHPEEDYLRQSTCGPQRIRLKVSETIVRDVKNNVEKYERYLRKTQHEKEGRFDPWKLVEEISDQVLEECLREIDGELDEIGESIVHRVCKSEFSVPDPSIVAEQVAAERLHDRTEEDKDERSKTTYDPEGTDYLRDELQDAVQSRFELERGELHQGKQDNIQHSRSRENSEIMQVRLGKIQEEGAQRQEQDFSEYGVDFNRDIHETPRGDFDSEQDDEDISPRVEHFETLADIEDLQPIETEAEIHTERDTEQVIGSIAYDPSQSEARQSMTRRVGRVEDYEEEEFEEEEEDDDDVEEVSSIDTDDLEYSTDET